MINNNNNDNNNKNNNKKDNNVGRNLQTFPRCWPLPHACPVAWYPLSDKISPLPEVVSRRRRLRRVKSRTTGGWQGVYIYIYIYKYKVCAIYLSKRFEIYTYLPGIQKVYKEHCGCQDSRNFDFYAFVLTRTGKSIWSLVWVERSQECPHQPTQPLKRKPPTICCFYFPEHIRGVDIPKGSLVWKWYPKKGLTTQWFACCLEWG